MRSRQRRGASFCAACRSIRIRDAYECAQLKVGLRRPGMVFIFSLRGPLCAGEAFIPSRPGGPSAALCYMARRDVGPRKELVPRPFTPHISASCVPQKGGHMVVHSCSCTRVWSSEWPGNTRGLGEHWRKNDDWRRVGPVSCQGPREGYRRWWRERVADGTFLYG